MKNQELIRQALVARESAYAPYSGFTVGAALLTKSGKIYTGCNIESASYSPTCCAERTAFFKAVSEGERDFEAIAIIGAPKDTIPSALCSPCGVCRQVISEFCEDSFKIILATSEENFEVFTLTELLPKRFKL